MRKFVLAAIAAVAAFGAPVSRAEAIPQFAHDYGMSCVKCHSVVPALNSFGQAFLDNGYRIPQIDPSHAFPISIRFNLAYSSAPGDSGLPKAIVDELELLSAGTIDRRTSYFVEQYVLDGGVAGSTRDAWLSFRLSGMDRTTTPISIRTGQFTLPLPVDPETFRDTAEHYAVFDQTVGTNAFKFFDTKTGADLHIGSALHGLSGNYAMVAGHDQQSGLPSDGHDTMFYLQDATGAVTLSSYDYSGTRPLGSVSDRFQRQGFGLSLYRGRVVFDNVVQTGFDTRAFGTGSGAASSGGFSQLRYAFSVKDYAIMRVDGTQDTNGFSRSATVLFGRRFARNTRFTIEDVVTPSHVQRNTLNTQLTVAF
jgi:hypothetical protein